jgi:flagellar basal-body rod modification protein FlgD
MCAGGQTARIRAAFSASRAAVALLQITALDFSSPVPSPAEGNSMITSPISSGAARGTQSKNKSFDLKAQDFIKMMVTQLQNQDPTKPADNGQLLAQMSQIGQLQSSTTLTESIKGLVLQNQIGSAGNLIGKNVAGVDSQNNPVNGVVNSVKVQSDGVVLELDNGNKLPLSNVTDIAAASATARGVTAAPASTGA